MTRRVFCATGVAVLGRAPHVFAASDDPWYRRTYRWGQTNITEPDALRYDIAWWRNHWKRTQVQGVIINAGGIVAYYPSKYPLHHRAQFLGDRDLYGELCQAAHGDGLVVLARMDSSSTAEAFYRAHPVWFTRNAAGEPYRTAERYVTCINGPYYEEYIPDILREIIERSHPEGFADNSWAGLNRDRICYCDNCARKFRDATRMGLPKGHDWNDRAYRRWVEWSYARRLAVWDLYNRVTKAAGGPECLWIGMNSGSIAAQSRTFRDSKAIAERAEMLLLDHQSRGSAGFQENADAGKLIHGILGWNKLVPESMAMYGAGGRATFRLASKPAAEARMWMIEGFAGGIQPWWHHVGAYHEDRRMYNTAEPLMRFYKENERFLVNRRPLAAVGLVWSQRSTDFYGQDNAGDLTELPYLGFMQALIRARIPYVPIHVDNIRQEAQGLSVLILPAIGAMSDSQCAAVRRFVQDGGSLIATGATSLYDEWGDVRQDFALADLFGAHILSTGAFARKPNTPALHTYFRLSPELRAGVAGPKADDEPRPSGRRHPVLKGFDETDLLPFGGVLEPLRMNAGVIVPLTFVPEFPAFPPEAAWMRQPRTDIPALLLNGRVAYLAADVDTRYGRDKLPDHASLLANLVRWAAADSIPLEVVGHGLLDCNVYTQPGRIIMHIVNLSNADRMPIEEYLPVGPFMIRVKLPKDVPGRRLRLAVSDANATPTVEKGWASFQVNSVSDHELIILE